MKREYEVEVRTQPYFDLGLAISAWAEKGWRLIQIVTNVEGPGHVSMIFEREAREN